MANYKTDHLDLTNQRDRAKLMSWCRRNAQTALARIHKDEYSVLLRLEYAAAGIEVRQTRLTAEQKRLRKIDKLRKELSALESAG